MWGAGFALFALISAATVLVTGCVSEERYHYRRIVSDYDRPVLADHRFDTETPAPTALPEPGAPVGLEEAVRIALENNPDMDAAVARIRQSEAIIDQAMAAFWPAVSAYSEYTAGDAPSAYFFKTIDQRNLPSQLNFNDPGSFKNLEIGLRARMNLFRGGRDYLRKRMAETGLEIRQLDRLSVQNGLVTSVIHAYFNTLAAEDFVRIAGESVETVQTQLRIMRVRFRAGGVLKSDVLSLEVRLAQAREDLIRSRNGLSLALASLANLMGLDPDTGMQIEEAGRVAVDLPPGYAQGLPIAMAHRPELEKARLAVISSRMGVDAARGEYLPRVDALAHYYFADEGARFDADRANWTAGVILDWELFSGGGTGSAVREAEGVLEEMLAADRKAALSVKLDLRTAYLALDEAEARVEVSRASVARAEESLRLVKKQYEGGSATVTRYLDAEMDRRWSEIRASAARYDLEKARADVCRALGRWAGLQVLSVGSRCEE
ncbi:MAG: TolC family protein [Desulfatiglandales bacterium]